MDFTIKKELSEEELLRLLNTFKTEVHNLADIQSLSRIMETYIKALTPAHYVHLFQVSDDKNLLYLVEESSSQTISLSEKKGMVIKCIKDEMPVSTNDIKRNSEYNPDIDNIFGYDLKNLLVIPLHDINNNIFAVLWAGILRNDINQFIQKDIENIHTLLQYLNFIVKNNSDSTKEQHNIENNDLIEDNDPLPNSKANKIFSDETQVTKKTFVNKLKALFSKK